MSIEERDIASIADGLALWKEHMPQSAEDWLRIASRMDAEAYETPNASPLFAALRQAVQDRDTNEMRATMAEEAVAGPADEGLRPETLDERLEYGLMRFNEGVEYGSAHPTVVTDAMVEKAAREWWECSRGPTDEPWDDESHAFRAETRRLIEIALTAALGAAAGCLPEDEKP